MLIRMTHGIIICNKKHAFKSKEAITKNVDRLKKLTFNMKKYKKNSAQIYLLNFSQFANILSNIHNSGRYCQNLKNLIAY